MKFLVLIFLFVIITKRIRGDRGSRMITLLNKLNGQWNSFSTSFDSYSYFGSKNFSVFSGFKRRV